MITVMFTCQKCGLEKCQAKVLPRGADQDIGRWTDEAMRECAKVHAIKSPLCSPDKFDLYIPIPPKDKAIGSTSIGRPLTDEEKKEWQDAINNVKKEHQ